MTRFVFLSFAFIGWAFYEVSGGQDFEPEEPRRFARLEEPEVTAALDTSPEEESVEALASAEPAAIPAVALAVPTTKILVSAPTRTPEAQRVALIPAPEFAKAEEPEAPLADIRTVRGSRVNMRSGPGTQYSVLTSLSRGERVAILREPGNGWVKLQVEDSGRIGWMAARLLRKVDGAN